MAGGWKGNANPLVYGVRNSRVTGGMVELMAGLGINFIDEKVEGREHLRDHALGNSPVLVNGTTNPLLLGAMAKKPEHMVLAVQVPFIDANGGPRQPLDAGSTFAPVVRRDGILDVGYYTPFSDPRSPRSKWYGIVARVVKADSGFVKDTELERMTDELIGMGAALGLEADDPDETMGRALVPSSSFGGVPDSARGTIELRRAYSGGHRT